MNSVETFEVGKRLVEIHYDQDPINPRTDFDHEDVMVCFHRKYNLGDFEQHDYKFEDYGSWDELEAAIRSEHNPDVLLPLYLYDHSGITISTTPFSCRWDSGQVGLVFLSKEKSIELFGENDAERESRAKAYVEASIKEYDAYLAGECYGFRVMSPENEDGEREEEDSCWGYLGDLEYCKEEARRVAEWTNNKEQEEAEKRGIQLDLPLTEN